MINADVYQKECLNKRLIPFYKKHKVPTIFWPDLASSHYSKTTINILNKKKVNLGQKNENPPNAPELRPIERYWAIAKRNLKKEGGEAHNMKEFKKNWSSATRKIKKKTVQNLMMNVKQKLRRKFRG